MISGTPHSPITAFTTFAREFFTALASDDYQGALGKLDASEKKWSKGLLQAELRRAIEDEEVDLPTGISRSAEPQLESTGSIYVLRHRLPVQRKWSPAVTTFSFHQKPNTQYFHVRFESAES